jgi:uncharacterized delta-60 repeat protein
VRVSVRVTTAVGLAGIYLAVFASSALALGAGDFDPTFSDDGYLVDPIGPPNSSGRRGGTPYSVSVLPDGKVLLVSNASDSKNSVTRLNEDGSFDTSFGGGTGTVNTRFGAGAGSLFPWTSVVQPDGKIVVGGYFYPTSGGQQAWIARTNADGSPDESFATGGFFSTQLGGTYSGFRELVLLPDGKILAVGGADSGGHGQTLLVRFDQEGRLDPTFGTGGKTLKLLGTGANANSAGETVATQPDGKIVVAGPATDADDAQPNATSLARFDADGKDLDPSFGTGGNFLSRLGKPTSFYMTPRRIALQPDGKVVVTGTGIQTSTSSGTDFQYVARVNADGQGMDSGFADGGVFRPTWAARGGLVDVALQPDGKIVAVGSYNASGVGIAGLFVRLTTAGQLDPTFAGTGYMLKQFAPPGTNTSDMLALAMDPRGKLVAVGETLEKLNGNLDERAIVARVITDLPPAAAFSVAPNPAQPGQAVAFDDAGSADPDGSVTDWSWAFGDGSTASGPHTTHAYAAPGTYTATLTVRDDYGQTATSSQAVTVNVPAPVPVTSTSQLPVLTGFTIRPSVFPAATRGGSIARKAGALVSYTDSVAATTTFTVARAMPGRKRGKSCVKPTRSNAKAKRCTRYVRVRGSFKHVDNVGKNGFRFTGRVGQKPLKPGRYRLSAAPKLAGRSGKVARFAFRIVPKK